MTLRVVELFAGIGAQRMALTLSGIPHKVVGISEIDKHALASYEAIYGDCPNLGDIKAIQRLPECDLVTYSFPCLTGDTLVETSEGWTPIKDVRPGDEVWSRDGWRRVTDHAMTGRKEVWEVKGSQTLPILATGYHPFLARRMSHAWNNDRRSYDRIFAPARWVKAEDLTTSDYLGYRIPEEGPMPEYEGYTRVYSDGRVYRRAGLASLWTDERLWWTFGRYVADGCVNHDGYAFLCIGGAKTEDFGKIPMRFTVSNNGRNCFKAIITSREFGMLCEKFGKGAENKRIPQEYKTLPKKLAKAMLDGYLSGDGWYNRRNGTWGATTVSRMLALDLAELVAYVHGRPSSITYYDPSSTKVIEGRTVSQKRQYTIRFHLDARKQDKAFAEDGWIWFPVKSVERTGKIEEVYDITVEGSHSFNAGGCIVKNCQDLSLAGKRKGMGKGTRSGLVWEVVRLLESAEHRPEWLLMENVPQVLTSPLWGDLVGRLEAMGYRNKWAKLDSSRFGSAQKRVRAFMVSRLGRDPPDLPQSAPNAPRLCLRDVMEPTREEKYVRRIPLNRIRWREPKAGYNHPQSEGIRCRLMDAGEARLETRRIAGEDSFCPALRTGCPQKIVDEEEEEERVRPLVGTADNLRLAPKGRKAIGTVKDGEVRLVVAPSDKPSASAPIAEMDDETGYNNSIKVFGCFEDAKGDGMLDQNIVPSKTFRNRRVYEDGGSAPACVVKSDCRIKVVADWQREGRLDLANRVYADDALSPAMVCHGGGNRDIKVAGASEGGELTVSILTPRECWRLMGFPDWAYNRAARVSSETQLYNQAGNSIVVEVLMAIFRAMFQPYRIQQRLDVVEEAEA